MSNTKKFMYLEALILMPYVTKKNIIIFLVLSIILGFGSKSISGPIGVGMFIVLLYISYLFAVGKNNKGMDRYYSVLPISRKTVVKGRYLFAFFFSLTTLSIISFISIIIKFFITGIDINDFLLVSLMILYYFFILSIQLAFFFKWGYRYSVFFVYMPILLVYILLIFINEVLKNHYALFYKRFLTFWLYDVGITNTIILSCLLCIVFFCISYFISLKTYSKREF